MGRSTRYGLDLPGYLHEANARTATLVMIEDAAGVEHVDDDRGDAGLDAIIVGPLDLSAGLGVIGETGHPKVHGRDRADRRRGQGRGRAGRPRRPAGRARELVEQGSHVTLIFFDALDIGAAARGAVEAARASLA